MRRIPLLVLVVVACVGPADTTTTIGETTTTEVTMPDPTTTEPEATTTTAESDVRAEFFAALNPDDYQGMTEDDVWILVEGYCHARETLDTQEVIDQTLDETGGLIDLTFLSGVVEELGTCT